MKGRILTKETITGFINHLHLEEKSANTIEKYARDVNVFAVYLNGNVVSKDLVIEAKAECRRICCEQYQFDACRREQLI